MQTERIAESVQRGDCYGGLKTFNPAIIYVYSKSLTSLKFLQRNRGKCLKLYDDNKMFRKKYKKKLQEMAVKEENWDTKKILKTR